MSDFLLELLCEEIPARMQARARNDLARLFAEELDKAGLATGAVDTHSTPRRLVLVARDVASETIASREEIKGPRSSAPPQALEGFLRKTGLSREQLEERDGVLFAVVEQAGQLASSVIAEALGRILADFPWPKSMRWGSGDERWVRPLQGIVAMLDEAIVPFEFAGVSAGAATVGHRFHHPGTITLGGADDYFEKMRACHVIVDQEERERIIRDGAAQAAKAAGFALVEDEGLVVENAGLAEWPVPLLGKFDPDFLDVPREVIVLTMRTNQKYFACTSEDGGLAPAFVCVANIDAKDGGAAIVEGNKRVLAARLSDARFFWEQDLKVPLEEQAKKLEGIVFHEKLGTVADKVERVARLARKLAEKRLVPGVDPDDVERAARLSKADLVTGMVGEFPELQGLIGGDVATAQGEKPIVAAAIRDHYQPVGQGGNIPTAPLTVALSLADKFDTLAGFFAIDERPTGSRDPFALRRAALGIVETVIQNRLRMDLMYAMGLAPPGYIRQRVHHGMSEAQVAEVTDGFSAEFFGALPEFIVDRLKVKWRSEGARHDLIDACTDEHDLVRLLDRVDALQGFVETSEGRDLLAGYKRAANILKKETWGADAASDGDVPAEEATLVKALDAAEPKAAKGVETENFTAAMSALASLRAPIDAFFDKVTVNDSDKGIRARRLNLLARFRDAVHQVADFSKIEG